MKKKHWIKEGIEVAHRDDLSTKMYVERILKRSRTIEDENGKESTILLTQGVECHWHENDYVTINDEKGNVAQKEVKKLRKARFHTRELIPFEIAEQGFIKVMEWIESQG